MESRNDLASTSLRGISMGAQRVPSAAAAEIAHQYQQGDAMSAPETKVKRWSQPNSDPLWHINENLTFEYAPKAPFVLASDFDALATEKAGLEAKLVYIVKTLDPHEDFDASPVEAIARGVMKILDNAEADRDRLLAECEMWEKQCDEWMLLAERNAKDRDRLRAALEAVTKRLSMVGSLYAADAAALDKARAALSPDNTKE
jgi:hypothetical protein